MSPYNSGSNAGALTVGSCLTLLHCAAGWNRAEAVFDLAAQSDSEHLFTISHGARLIRKSSKSAL